MDIYSVVVRVDSSCNAESVKEKALEILDRYNYCELRGDYFLEFKHVIKRHFPLNNESYSDIIRICDIDKNNVEQTTKNRIEIFTNRYYSLLCNENHYAFPIAKELGLVKLKEENSVTIEDYFTKVIDNDRNNYSEAQDGYVYVYEPIDSISIEKLTEEFNPILSTIYCTKDFLLIYSYEAYISRVLDDIDNGNSNDWLVHLHAKEMEN
jgi:hypothetical protein